MVNVMGIKYAEATIRQLAKAKAQSKYPVNRFGEGINYKAILETLKREESSRLPAYKNYDRWGRLTGVGKEVRKYFLKKNGLPENTTIAEYFEKEFEKSHKTIQKVVKRVQKAFIRDGKNFDNWLSGYQG